LPEVEAEPPVTLMIAPLSASMASACGPPEVDIVTLLAVIFDPEPVA
jgi:hypothetical protein